MNHSMREYLLHKRSMLRALFLFAGLITVTGCATGATYNAMVSTKVGIMKKHPKSVCITVTGGKATESTGTPQISNEAFLQALEESITKSQVFTGVVKGGNADYQLSVHIFSIDQPLIGFSFTVKMEAGWILKRADNAETVWQESITSESTATVGDAFAGVVRLRMATEGAAKENIAQGLTKISKLNL